MSNDYDMIIKYFHKVYELGHTYGDRKNSEEYNINFKFWAQEIIDQLKKNEKDSENE
jgi:hypothetical protein